MFFIKNEMTDETVEKLDDPGIQKKETGVKRAIKCLLHWIVLIKLDTVAC